PHPRPAIELGERAGRTGEWCRRGPDGKERTESRQRLFGRARGKGEERKRARAVRRDEKAAVRRLGEAQVRLGKTGETAAREGGEERGAERERDLGLLLRKDGGERID